MAMQQKLLELEVVCPFCGKSEHIKISQEEILASPIGVLRIPLEHEDPEPHVLVLDIDPSGFVRGAYLLRKYTGVRSLSGMPIREIIKSIGIENFANLLGWLLAGYNISFATDKFQYSKELKILLSVIFGDRKSNRINLKLDPKKVREPPFSTEILRKNLESAMANISDDEALVTYIKNEIERYRQAIRKIIEVLEIKTEINLNDLKALLGDSMTDQEIRFLVAIVAFIHPEYKPKINMPELKIADIL